MKQYNGVPMDGRRMVIEVAGQGRVRELPGQDEVHHQPSFLAPTPIYQNSDEDSRS